MIKELHKTFCSKLEFSHVGPRPTTASCRTKPQKITQTSAARPACAFLHFGTFLQNNNVKWPETLGFFSGVTGHVFTSSFSGGLASDNRDNRGNGSFPNLLKVKQVPGQVPPNQAA